jgi:hypothetical protein
MGLAGRPFPLFETEVVLSLPKEVGFLDWELLLCH